MELFKKMENYIKLGISMTAKSVISVLVFLIINIITKNLIISCLSIVITNIAIILVYDYKNIKQVKLIKTKFSNTANNRLFRIGFFTFILTFLGIYLINSPRYAIDDILSNDLQTIFGIIIMPATFMGLLGQYIIQPLLVQITECIKYEKYNELRNMIIKIIRIILVLGIAVFIVAYFLEVPVLQIVYGIELQQYFASMLIIIVGSILYSIEIIISTILISMRKTFMQVIIYGVTAIISTVLSYSLVKKIQLQGAAITYFVTMLIVVTLFIIYLIYNMKKYKREWKESENINNNSNI